MSDDKARALLAAAKWMFGAIESGELVRDISRDGDPDWTMRMMKFTVELSKAQTAITRAEQ